MNDNAVIPRNRPHHLGYLGACLLLSIERHQNAAPPECNLAAGRPDGKRLRGNLRQDFFVENAIERTRRIVTGPFERVGVCCIVRRFRNGRFGQGPVAEKIHVQTASGQRFDVEIDTDNGLRTYRENIRKHFRTSLASVEGALNLRPELLRYQKEFYETALEEAGDAAVQGYVFSAPDDPARMYHFLDILDYHRIQAYRLAQEITEGGMTFSPGEAVVVPVNQPQYRLIRGIFET
ncbi:MAG: hypothetical protein ACREQ1_09615, partial [Woeseiaceae bacterium]